MKKLLLLAAMLVVLGIAAPVRAQDTSRGNVYIGFDWTHFAVSNTAFGQPSGFTTANLYGGKAQGAFYVLPYLAAVAEIGGDFLPATNTIAGTFGPGYMVSYMFGPRLNLSRGRVQPYLQVLLGASTLSPRIATTNGAATNTGTDNEFSMTAGGGVDVTLTRHIALRPAQVEYYLTRFYDCQLGPPASACTGIVRSQNNFRYSGGIVIRFGGK